MRQAGNLRGMLPGLGTAIAIFGTYMFAEKLYEKIVLRNETKQQVAAAPTEKETVSE